MVALTVLSIAGLAFVELTAQAVRAMTHARAVEERLADEDRLLAAYTLLDRRDLEQRIGTHPVGTYLVRVERTDRGLFRIAIGDPGAVPDLTTALYRPELADE